ncbi:hypothetical protein F4777DRAFT_572967 [Nemania sp. FL0916]|nr:hypothetical protein F4777DRAFT_572967 [Nemania sp. FL0916]
MDIRSGSHSWDLTRVTLVFSWLLTSLAIVAVFARFYLRRKFSNGWAAHDWIMLLALIFQIAFQGGLSQMCAWGSGRPSVDLTEHQINAINRLGWIIIPLSHPTSVLARISIALLLIHIFGAKTWFKWYIIFFTTFVTLSGATALVITVAQVRPYEALWDESITNYTAWDMRIYQWTGIILQFIFAIWDSTFVFIPVLIIWDLNMATSQKIGLIILLAFGLITSAAVVVKAVISLLFTIGSSISLDDRRGTHLIVFTTCLEQSLVIIIGCIPTLRAITRIRHLDIRAKIGGYLVYFFSRTKKYNGRNARRRSFSRGDESWPFDSLELTPANPLFKGETIIKKSSSSDIVLTSTNEAESNLTVRDSQVYRTDSFSVRSCHLPKVSVALGSIPDGKSVGCPS